MLCETDHKPRMYRWDVNGDELWRLDCIVSPEIEAEIDLELYGKWTVFK